MKRKFKILITLVALCLPLLIAYQSNARDESARKETFNEDSPFDDRAFETQETRGEELLGVPDPPDENGDPIETPIGGGILEIITLLSTGILVIRKLKK